jgi:hypothetical protein
VQYSLISFFLQITENISYDPLKLPEPVHSRIAESLGKLLKLADSDSRKLESHVLAVGGSLPKPLNVTVSAVKYGFKAPVAMLLAPYWALLMKDFKMLHVLRDGRDIAFSANQVCCLHYLTFSKDMPVASYSAFRTVEEDPLITHPSVIFLNMIPLIDP